jgi:hypothetical protein
VISTGFIDTLVTEGRIGPCILGVFQVNGWLDRLVRPRLTLIEPHFLAAAEALGGGEQFGRRRF